MKKRSSIFIDLCISAALGGVVFCIIFFALYQYLDIGIDLAVCSGIICGFITHLIGAGK